MTYFNETLGLAGGADQAVHLDTKEEHQVVEGVIHFAVLATMAEVAASKEVGDGVPVSVQLNLLRAAKPGHLEAKGRLLKRGKRLAVAEGEVWQDANLIAKAAVTFSVM